MQNHLSILGIFHTAISILALFAAYVALYREGRINPKSGAGKLYVILTIVTCLSAFPIMKLGHPTAGHYVGILILILLPVGIYAKQLLIFGKLAVYVQVIILSTTLFFSMIPAIVETLTRLPIDHPLAAGPNDVIVQKGLTLLMLLYVVGVLYQIVKLRSQRKSLNNQNPAIS